MLFRSVSQSRYNLVCDFALYGLSSTTSYYNDLRNISGFLAGGVDTPSTGLAIDASSKVFFESAILDLTLRNDSTKLVGGNAVNATEAKLEVDLYEITMRHTAEETGSTYKDLSSIFDQNATRTFVLGGAGTTLPITRTKRGCTPFDYSYSLSRFGVKIWKKTKFTINNGDQITYQLRDPKSHQTLLS